MIQSQFSLFDHLYLSILTVVSPPRRQEFISLPLVRSDNARLRCMLSNTKQCNRNYHALLLHVFTYFQQHDLYTISQWLPRFSERLRRTSWRQAEKGRANSLHKRRGWAEKILTKWYAPSCSTTMSWLGRQWKEVWHGVDG